MGGGSSIGKIGAVAAGLNAGCANGRRNAGIIGWTGVPNAGDDEKTFVSVCFRIESIVGECVCVGILTALWLSLIHI